MKIDPLVCGLALGMEAISIVIGWKFSEWRHRVNLREIEQLRDKYYPLSKYQQEWKERSPVTHVEGCADFFYCP